MLKLSSGLGRDIPKVRGSRSREVVGRVEGLRGGEREEEGVNGAANDLEKELEGRRGMRGCWRESVEQR